MSLLTSLRAELLKTKRTSSFYLTIAAAAFGPLMSMLDLVFDGVDADHKKDIFNELLTTKFVMTGAVLLPWFIILICTLLPQIEYKNDTWKQVLTSPQTKGNVFLAKFINVQFLIILFLFINQLLMLVDAVILHFIEPSLHVLNQPVNVSVAFITLANSYVALLAMCSIQFWLGLRFRNFIVPIAIGIVLWFVGSILVVQFNAGFAAYFPYSFHIYTSFPKHKLQLSAIGWTSLIYAIVFLAVGFIDFKRRRMKA